MPSGTALVATVSWPGRPLVAPCRACHQQCPPACTTPQKDTLTSPGLNCVLLPPHFPPCSINPFSDTPRRMHYTKLLV